MNQVLKFIHISDLHFSAKSNCLNIPQAIYDNGLGKVFVYFIKEDNNKYNKTTLYPHSYNSEIFVKLDIELQDLLDKEFANSGGTYDFILITGDISTTASKDDLQAAKDLLTGEIGFDEIENIPIDPFFEKNKYPQSYYESVQLLPGNHDRFQIHGDSNFKDQGLETFSEVFREKWEKNIRINFTYDDHFIALFVDFSLPKNFNSGIYFDHDNGNKKINKKDKYKSFLGRGIYTKKLRKELEDLLDKFKKSPLLKDKKILFFSHFSLNSSYDSLRLINAKMLIATLQKYNITTYFCGHTHEIDFIQIEDNIQHICCGSTTGCDMNDKYSFLVHTISIDTENIYTLKSDSYIYSTEDRYFKKDNSRKCLI